MNCGNWFVGTLTSVILATATLAGQQPIQKSGEDSLPIQGFSVALLLGEMQGTSTPDNVLSSAKKALADVRDFLPFKSYRQLDTQWILCCGNMMAKAAGSKFVNGRLRGLEDQLYSFFIEAGSTGSRLSIRFSLREESPVKKLSGTDPEEKPPTPFGKSSLIDSTFLMDVGETVVIGTSSLKADKALIAVLTAARKPDTHTKTFGEKR